MKEIKKKLEELREEAKGKETLKITKIRINRHFKNEDHCENHTEKNRN